MNRASKVEFDRFEAAINVVDVHAAGEPCRVAVGGFPEPEGASMIEKRRWMEEHVDGLRRALMHEPRGHHDMFGAFLCDPVDPSAHVGVVFMDTGGYLNMCGHGTIGVVTVVLETGVIAVHEGENEVVLDAPAGLIRATACVKNGRVESVSFVNVPSFVYRENVTVEVEGRAIQLAIAFGGSFFALVDASALGLGDIGPENAPAYAHLGTLVREAVNRRHPPKHPTLNIDTVDLVEFYTYATEPSDQSMRHIVVFGAESIDRSPCGTGLSAQLAMLRHRGIIECGEPVRCESFIGTSFTGVVECETTVGGFDAVAPRITGRAFLTGAGTCLVDADDPLGYGFLPAR